MGRMSVKEKYQEPVLLSKDEAMPCPFCGDQPVMQAWHGGGPRKVVIECVSDFCYAQPGVSGESPTIALRRWNHRSKKELH